MSGSRDSANFVALVQATAGAVGGIFAAVVLQPVEVAKTRSQVREQGDDESTAEMVREIVRVDGLPGLFRGLVAKCYETGTKNFVYFYIYDAINAMAKPRMSLTTPVKLLLGFTAGVGATVITMPLEVLATIQAESNSNLSNAALAQKILQKEGLGGLFRGFWYNMLLCVNPAIQNTAFDKMKDLILKAKAKSERHANLTPLQAFMLGAVAKALATVVTYPMVRLKTILQAGKDKAAAPAAATATANGNANAVEATSAAEVSSRRESRVAPPKERGTQLEALLRGFTDLYQGIGFALAKSVLQAALLYMTKDQVGDFVRILFKLSSRAFFRKDGRLKLGVFSGRPLPS